MRTPSYLTEAQWRGAGLHLGILVFSGTILVVTMGETEVLVFSGWMPGIFSVFYNHEIVPTAKH
jgi:uncharacterized membrane protein YgdD (TMEM256/DUF423 family)